MDAQQLVACLIETDEEEDFPIDTKELSPNTGGLGEAALQVIRRLSRAGLFTNIIPEIIRTETGKGWKIHCRGASTHETILYHVEHIARNVEEEFPDVVVRRRVDDYGPLEAWPRSVWINIVNRTKPVNEAEEEEDFPIDMKDFVEQAGQGAKAAAQAAIEYVTAAGLYTNGVLTPITQKTSPVWGLCGGQRLALRGTGTHKFVVTKVYEIVERIKKEFPKVLAGYGMDQTDPLQEFERHGWINIVNKGTSTMNETEEDELDMKEFLTADPAQITRMSPRAAEEQVRQYGEAGQQVIEVEVWQRRYFLEIKLTFSDGTHPKTPGNLIGPLTKTQLICFKHQWPMFQDADWVGYTSFLNESAEDDEIDMKDFIPDDHRRFAAWLENKFRKHLHNVHVHETPAGYRVTGQISTVAAPLLAMQVQTLLTGLETDYPLAAYDWDIKPLAHDPTETELSVSLRPGSMLEALEDDDEPDDFAIDPKELSPLLNVEDQWILDQLNAGHMELSCRIVRREHHYVHERTTTSDFESNYYLDEVVDAEAWEQKMDATINELEKAIDQEIVIWNREIYKALTDEWEYRNSDTVVDEDILANQYEFDEDGNRVVNGPIQFDQLGARAKKNARNWFREGIGHDTHWSVYVIDDWRQRLEAKGFSSVDIQFSGFGSQGDGASFTGSISDWEKYFNGPNPLTYHAEVIT